MSALDDRIDDLYKGPLGDFTTARNALAKTLSADRAKQVKALSKPTLVPWAVNQLYWHSRKMYDRLIERGAQLRKAQIAALSGKGDANALRDATDAHRAAVAEAVREIGRIAGTGPQHAEPVSRTLQALSVSPEPPEPHGRLTEVLQPAGFEALAGVTPHARRTQETRSVRLQPDVTKEKARSLQADKESRAEAQKLEAEKKKHDAEIRKAEAVVERVRAAETLARQAHERAKRELDEAEARLKRTRDRS